VVSIRKAKKLAARKAKEHWRRVFPPTKAEPVFPPVSFCQEQVQSAMELPREGAEVRQSSDKSTPARKSPSWLAYLLEIGAFSIVFGGGTLMWQNFVIGTSCVYVGLLLLALDLYFRLRDRRGWKSKWPILFPLLLAILFTYYWTLKPAPLYLAALDFGKGIPDADGKIGGISWKDGFYEIQLSVANHTDDDYTDVRIWVRTDEYIANIGKLGKCLDGSVEPSLRMGGYVARGQNGEIVENHTSEGPIHMTTPSSPNVWYHGPGNWQPVWDIECPILRNQDMISFVIAVVNLREKTYDELPPNTPRYAKFHVEYYSTGHRKRTIDRQLPIFPIAKE